MNIGSSRHRSKDEGGFTLVEVLIAFGIFAVVLVGAVPMLYAGLRTTTITRLDTQAKNLAQERLELMRNIPFHVDVNAPPVKPAVCTSEVNRTSPEAGAVDCDYRDVLDTYFRSVTPAASVTAGGYVAPASTARTSDEPTGAFYRFVVNPIPGFGRFSQVIATQFLNVNRAAVTPQSGYNSQVAGQDFPTSRLLGVTIITTWQAGNLTKKLVMFSQVADAKPGVPSITLQAQATALKVNGGMPPLFAGQPGPLLTLEAGISSSDGALSTGASASTHTLTSFASLAPGQRVEGRSKGASAPPNQSEVDGDGFPFSLIDGGGESSPDCLTFACVGYSAGGANRNVNASISSGVPNVSTAAAPATGRVKSSGTSGRLNVGFRNRPEASSMPGLDITKMMVSILETTSTSATTVGSTYLTSTSGSGHYAEAGAKANTSMVRIAPTTFAPEGIVQVTLTSSSLVCNSNGTVGTAVGDFAATVNYLRYNATSNLNEYVSLTVEDGQALSPLNVALIASTQVTTTPGGPPTLVALSAYIDSWGSLTQASTTTSSPPTLVASSLSGIVTVTTKPTRSLDPSSVVAVQVGILSCVAEDHR